MEKKVFGYPKFDEKGEMILTTYDNEYRDMLMDIRVYKLTKGETLAFTSSDEEVAVLLLNGELEGDEFYDAIDMIVSAEQTRHPELSSEEIKERVQNALA